MEKARRMLTKSTATNKRYCGGFELVLGQRTVECVFSSLADRPPSHPSDLINVSSRFGYKAGCGACITWAAVGAYMCGPQVGLEAVSVKHQSA